MTDSMKFIQSPTFPETAIQQRELSKQTLIRTDLYTHYQTPLPIIDIIVDTTMPARLDAQLM